MYRRFLLISCKRTLLFLLLICAGCSAQLAPSEVSQKIERQLRPSYNVPADVKVSISSPKASEFPNYDTITVTFSGDGRQQQYDFLLSKDQNTLIRMTKMDLTKDPYQATIDKINIKGRPVRGNPNAKVTLVNFDDFECPYCSQMHKQLFPELMKEYGDRVAFVYKDFPLSEIHPWAIHAAVDANCLAAQSNDAYWDFADFIHSNQDVVNSEKGLDNRFAALDKITLTEGAKFHVDAAKLQACMKDPKDEAAVNASEKEGEALNVSGTPTMFINGQMLDGARPASEVRAALDSALQRAGVPAPAHPSTLVLTPPSKPAAPANNSTTQH